MVCGLSAFPPKLSRPSINVTANQCPRALKPSEWLLSGFGDVIRRETQLCHTQNFVRCKDNIDHRGLIATHLENSAALIPHKPLPPGIPRGLLTPRSTRGAFYVHCIKINPLRADSPLPAAVCREKWNFTPVPEGSASIQPDKRRLLGLHGWVLVPARLALGLTSGGLTCLTPTRLCEKCLCAD